MGFQDVEMGAVTLRNRRLTAEEVAHNCIVKNALYNNTSTNTIIDDGLVVHIDPANTSLWNVGLV